MTMTFAVFVLDFSESSVKSHLECWSGREGGSGGKAGGIRRFLQLKIHCGKGSFLVRENKFENQRNKWFRMWDVGAHRRATSLKGTLNNTFFFLCLYLSSSLNTMSFSFKWFTRCKAQEVIHKLSSTMAMTTTTTTTTVFHSGKVTKMQLPDCEYSRANYDDDDDTRSTKEPERPLPPKESVRVNLKTDHRLQKRTFSFQPVDIPSSQCDKIIVSSQYWMSHWVWPFDDESAKHSKALPRRTKIKRATHKSGRNHWMDQKPKVLIWCGRVEPNRFAIIIQL